MERTDTIDIKDISNNFGKVVDIHGTSLVFMEPKSFKEKGFDQYGFVICRSMDWLETASPVEIRSSTNADKILRVTAKEGKKHMYSVHTVAYVVSEKFYLSRFAE